MVPNGKKTLFLNDKLILLVSCYDIIMKLSEFSELSEDYIADIRTKLGLPVTFVSLKLHNRDHFFYTEAAEE